MAFRISTGVMTEALKSLTATDISSFSQTLDEGKIVQIKFGAIWIWLVKAIVDEDTGV